MAEEPLVPEVTHAPEPPVEPAVTPPAPVAADPPAPAPEPPAPPAAVDPAAPREHGNKGRQPWYLTRISEAEHAKRQANEAREAEKRRADAAEEMLARLQRGEQPTGTQPPAPQRQPGQSQEEFQREVKAEAQRQRIFEDTVAVRDAGLEKFPDFNETLNVLTAIGLTRDDVVADLIAVDKANAHAILDKLAKDQDKAAAIAAMSPARRIAEFTRMSMAETEKPAPQPAPAPKPAAPSKAPPPPPKLAPVAERPEGEDFSDDRSDEEWSAAWDRKFLKRA
ncbi:MAG TPA: hypothetical protein VKX28_26895 [Xanthobacteraceae bacterium]|nr:hypothetical protein [Xanthobacteraceae bacterium]